MKAARGLGTLYVDGMISTLGVAHLQGWMSLYSSGPEISGELFLGRMKPEENLIESGKVSIVQVAH